MSDTYVINTVFKAHDQLSSTVQQVTGKMGAFGRVSDRNFKKATASAVRFKTVLGGVLGANLLTAGLSRLRQDIGGITEEFVDFDHTVTSAAAKWDIDRGTDAFRQLGSVVRDVAKITPHTAGQAGQALDYLALAGFNASDAMSALPNVTQLATAAQTDLARAADMSSDILRAFNKDVGDLSHINDVLAKTTTTSNTNLEMLFESMKMVAPVASGLGSNIEELSAMLGTLANSGIKATMSGTAMRRMYVNLTGGTAGVKKTLNKYNIDVLDPHTKKMRSLIDILEDVKQKTKHLNDAKRQEAYTSLFGARAVASAMILMKEGSKSLHEYEERLKGSTNAAAKLAERMGKSFRNRLAILKARLVEIGIKILDVFEKEIPNAFNKIEKWLDQFDGEDFKLWVLEVKDQVVPLAKGIASLVEQGGKLVSWLSDSGVTLAGAAKAFIAWKVATLALNTALVATKTSLGGLVAAKGFGLIKGVAAAMGVAGGAIAGAGALGAYGVGSHLLKGQEEANARMAEMKRREKTKRIVSISERSFNTGDKTLDEMSKQRYEETGTVPASMQKVFSEIGRAPRILKIPSNTENKPVISKGDLPEKSVVEVEIKSPFETETKVKQGKNAPVVRANKKTAPAISSNLGQQ